MFARQFTPKISKASTEYMVEEYKKLRQRDSSGKWDVNLCGDLNLLFQVQPVHHGESLSVNWRV